MYLKHFTNLGKCTRFDPAEGTGGAWQDAVDRETAGFCKRTDAGWVAIYPDPEGETLLVQIDGTTWNLYDPGTVVTYAHRYDEAETYFEITDGSTTATVTYDAWWADEEWFDPDPQSASRERENAEEDIFGYVLYLSRSEDRKEDFVEPWSDNLLGQELDDGGGSRES